MAGLSNNDYNIIDLAHIVHAPSRLISARDVEVGDIIQVDWDRFGEGPGVDKTPYRVYECTVYDDKRGDISFTNVDLTCISIFNRRQQQEDKQTLTLRAEKMLKMGPIVRRTVILDDRQRIGWMFIKRGSRKRVMVLYGTRCDTELYAALKLKESEDVPGEGDNVVLITFWGALDQLQVLEYSMGPDTPSESDEEEKES